VFRTSLPATADSFQNRDVELRRIERLVADLDRGEPRWLAILGPRKVGKTSLVLEIARRRSDARTRFVTLDTTDSLPLSLHFFRRYAAAVLDAALGRGVGLALPHLLANAAEFRAALQRSTVFGALDADLRVHVQELPTWPLGEATVRACLELPERLAAALDLRIVVAIDEFQELAGLAARRGGQDPLPMMRAVWQRHQRIAYVVSGSGRSMLTRMVTDDHSPFFQHFDVMRLDPFSPEAAKALLRDASPPGRAIGPDLAEKAMSVLGTHPFYLQLFGETLTASEPPYDEAELKAAIQALLFSRTGRLALYFEGEYQRLVGRSTFLAATLTALAAGKRRVGEIATEIGATSGATVSYLSRLEDAVRRADDGAWSLDDPVFQLWLRWRQPGGTVLPMSLIGTEAELRVAEHLARSGFELIYLSRASRGPFDLLATRAGRQLGVQVKRSGSPLRFQRTEWTRMVAEAKTLRWTWAIARVSPEGQVRLLDPAKAKRGQQVRIADDAAIENVLEWMEF
jgi:AAA+ ATPase superfamily predicted ATPase